jgi:hypothetical protein
MDPGMAFRMKLMEVNIASLPIQEIEGFDGQGDQSETDNSLPGYAPFGHIF